MIGRTVYLGNHQAVEVMHVEDENGQIVGENRKPVDGKQCTTFSVPDTMPFVEALTNIVAAWPYHSDADSAVWVASNHPALAAALAEHYGCEIREPEPAGVDGAD